MKRIGIFIIGICMAFPVMAEETWRAQGYGYFGVMASNDVTYGKVLNPGLGAELFLYKGLAASADLGYAGYYNNFRSNGLGLFSPNLSYHFVNSSRFVPFVTGGYTLAFRTGTSSLGNYGAGVTYWFSRRIGFRAEFRDHRDDNGFRITGTRFGISLR